jgi:hypothetical protein
MTSFNTSGEEVEELASAIASALEPYSDSRMLRIPPRHPVADANSK